MTLLTQTPAALTLEGISKQYPGVRALDDVSISLAAGRVHAILGENGAGKSTLVGIAAGSVVPDAGTIGLAGRTHEQLRPAAARADGLAIVYQTPALAPSLSVVDAVLTLLPEGKVPARREAENWLSALLSDLGLPIDPRAIVGDLSQREAHLIEIAAALASDPEVLVLDEPTEALGPEETEWLFERIAGLVERGVAVAYITHRIPEVVAIASDLTVLRDGKVVGRGEVADFTADEIVALIIGRSLETTFPPKSEAAHDSEVLLSVSGLSGPGFTDASFEVRRGQIVGLAGVEGNGQRQLLRALAGGGSSAGSVSVSGKRVSVRSHRAASRAGVVFLPGDRLGEAMFGNLSIRENVVAPSLGDAMPRGLTRRSTEYDLTQEAIREFAVKTATLETRVSALSGGSQQKVLLARARLGNPRVLLVEDPTQGVDAGARVEIYAFLRNMAASGVAVVVLSTDAVELEGLCDRVLVLSRGHLAADLTGNEITERAITGVAVLSTGHHGTLEGAAHRATRRGRLTANLQTLVLLGLVVAMAGYTTSQSSSFLDPINVSQLLAATAVLVFVGLAQLVVVVTGGIDLSVGSMVALSGVVVSFFAGGSAGSFAAGALLAICMGAAVGGLNGLLVTKLQIPAVIATLVSAVAVLGLAQVLRPQPGGTATSTIMTALGTTIATVPVLLMIALGAAGLVAFAMARTSTGRSLRAVGSDPVKANRMGVNVPLARVLAMAVAGIFSACAGVALYAQTGVGDANSGQALTLASVTVIVLAGVNIFGGSGSAIGVAVAALLLQVITNALTFLGLSLAWQYWLQGAFVIVAAVIPMLMSRNEQGAAS